MTKLPVPVRKWIGRAVTYVFYGISLVFFFSSSLESTFQYFGKVFSGGGISLRTIITQIPLSAIILLVLVMVLELFAEDFKKIHERIEQFWSGEGLWNRSFRWACYSLILSILFVTGNEIQQFIYVQF